MGGGGDYHHDSGAGVFLAMRNVFFRAMLDGRSEDSR